MYSRQAGLVLWVERAPERIQAKLDETLIGEPVYMRWETYGWQLGKITGVVTEATPLACSRSSTFAWSGWTRRRDEAGLTVKNYAYGPDARLNSWVILKKAE